MSKIETRLVYDAEVTMLLQSNLIENEPTLQALHDAIGAWNYLMEQDELTDEVVLRVHELLMDTRELSERYKGFYRQIPVYIGSEGKMNWRDIPKQMEDWIEGLNRPTSFINDVPKAGLAQDMHVVYEKIHPFVDGNGRTGRMFYNWHRLRLGLPVHVINSDSDSRREYYGWFK